MIGETSLISCLSCNGTINITQELEKDLIAVHPGGAELLYDKSTASYYKICPHCNKKNGFIFVESKNGHPAKLVQDKIIE